MEKFIESLPSKPLKWPKEKTWALAGVVGSGNLEILIEPDPDGAPDSVTFDVQTSIPGYRDSWFAGLEDFAALFTLGGARVTLHDQGAPPMVVKLRLRQALDQLQTP